MSIAVETHTTTARAVIDDKGEVMVILSGADAADVASEYEAEGYRVILIRSEF